MLLLFIFIAGYYFYTRRMVKNTYSLQQLQPVDSNLPTDNFYDIIRNEYLMESSEETTEVSYVTVGNDPPTPARDVDTNSALYDSVTIAQGVVAPHRTLYANVEPLESNSNARNSCNFETLSDACPAGDEKLEDGNEGQATGETVPKAEIIGTELTKVHDTYDVLTTREGIYNTLDHKKPQSQQDNREVYDTLKHRFKAQPVKSALSGDPMYDRVGESEAAKPIAPHEAAYSFLDIPAKAKYSKVNKSKTETFKLEGARADTCSSEPADDDAMKDDTTVNEVSTMDTTPEPPSPCELIP